MSFFSYVFPFIIAITTVSDFIMVLVSPLPLSASPFLPAHSLVSFLLLPDFPWVLLVGVAGQERGSLRPNAQ